jgi:hypothetical protein
MGMKARRDIVGDTGPNHYSRWDPIWNLRSVAKRSTHMLVSINAKTEDFIEERYLQLQQILARAIIGSRGPAAGRHAADGASRSQVLLDYQPSAALVDRWNKEHFGFSDGISDILRECGEDPRLVIGGGNRPAGSADARGLGAAGARRVHPRPCGRVRGLPEAPGRRCSRGTARSSYTTNCIRTSPQPAHI